MTEKTYIFKLSESGTLKNAMCDYELVQVKESELTKPQKDLLVGEVIKQYNNLPNELKTKFLSSIDVPCSCGENLHINAHCSICDNDD